MLWLPYMFGWLLLFLVTINFYHSFGLGTAQAKDRVSYFHSDISGLPIAATNADGELLWEETYKPYGERLNSVKKIKPITTNGLRVSKKRRT